MYIVKNNTTGQTEIIGSISAISKHTAIKCSVLYQQFSRNKKLKFETETWLIEKKEVIKQRRK